MSKAIQHGHLPPTVIIIIIIIIIIIPWTTQATTYHKLITSMHLQTFLHTIHPSLTTHIFSS